MAPPGTRQLPSLAHCPSHPPSHQLQECKRTLAVTTPWGHLPRTHPPLHCQPPTILRLQLGAGLGCHQAGHEAMVAGWSGRSGTQRDSATRSTRSRTGGWGDLTCGGHVLRGQLSIQLDAVQLDLGCAAGLALILHSCTDKVASAQATLLSPPAIGHCCVLPHLTVLVHASLQALLEPAGLALVAVSLVHWAQSRPRLASAGRGSTWLQPLRWPLSLRRVLLHCYHASPHGFPPPNKCPSTVGTLSPRGVLSPVGALSPCQGCPLPIPRVPCPCWMPLSC